MQKYFSQSEAVISSMLPASLMPISSHDVFDILTILMSDSLLRGSSQASKAEETRMQTRMKLDMMG